MKKIPLAQAFGALSARGPEPVGETSVGKEVRRRRIASVFSAMEVWPVRTTRISAGTIAPAEVEISCGPEPLEHERDECFAGGRRARPALEVRAPGL
jgi:hypothetical protein